MSPTMGWVITMHQSHVEMITVIISRLDDQLIIWKLWIYMYIQSIYLFGCTKNLNDYDAQTILCRNKICININHFFLLLIAILFVTYVKKHL